MNTQTQQEIINLINQISIATTDKANDEYQIELLTQHLAEIAKGVDIRTGFLPDSIPQQLIHIFNWDITAEMIINNIQKYYKYYK